MPGELRKDAKCPECGSGLKYTLRTATADGTEYQYHHHASQYPCIVYIYSPKDTEYAATIYAALHTNYRST